jgi:hypothetical protein
MTRALSEAKSDVDSDRSSITRGSIYSDGEIFNRLGLTQKLSRKVKTRSRDLQMLSSVIVTEKNFDIEQDNEDVGDLKRKVKTKINSLF